MAPRSKPTDGQERGQLLRVLGEADQPADAARETPLTSDPPPDRKRTFRSVNLSRMRTEWPEEDQPVVAIVKARADKELHDRFAEVFALRDQIRRCVRVAKLVGGSPIADAEGNPIWETDEDGVVVEDWTLLSDQQRDHFIYTIQTYSFDWDQAAVAMWHEAMLAKVQWEQAFARGFLEPQGRYTVDDKTHEGHYASDLERYHAIYLSALSRGADAIVRNMAGLQATLERTRR